MKEACITGDLQQVLSLLENGYDPTINDNLAIQLASVYGYLNIVKLLLYHGCDPKADNNFAILYASKNGHLDVVKLLLQFGCNPTVNDNWAIKWAIFNGHFNVVKLLFKWCLAHGINLPYLPKLQKLLLIKREIIHEIFLIYELKLPEDLCHLIQKFT
jgi:hypothetical protein